MLKVRDAARDAGIVLHKVDETTERAGHKLRVL
jgi:hypothetical protein